ncbi:unnamed protein product [Calicophoron daubneyi]|uniref:Uncharacterized protein n=1 Tax=Calicophoron daubneyi TaxID=300641 RepID=A0AAV2THA5_CALDB
MGSIENLNRVRSYTILVIGPSKVGKTAIVRQFVDRKFTKGDETALDVPQRKQCWIDGEECELIIIDIPYKNTSTDSVSRNRLLDVYRDYIADAQGYILCYALDSLESFTLAWEFYRSIIFEKLFCPIVLVGNKNDKKNRAVNHIMALETTHSWRCPHFETCANCYMCVQEIFAEIVRRIKAQGE